MKQEVEGDHFYTKLATFVYLGATISVDGTVDRHLAVKFSKG